MKKYLTIGLVFVTISLLNLFCISPLISKANADDSSIPSSVNTAVGEVGTNFSSLSKNVFDLVLGVAGTIALIATIIAGYKYMISQGNPEALKSASTQLTSAIIGLLFIIFSFVILQIIGSDIFGIDKFKNLQ